MNIRSHEDMEFACEDMSKDMAKVMLYSIYYILYVIVFIDGKKVHFININYQ